MKHWRNKDPLHYFSFHEKRTITVRQVDSAEVVEDFMVCYAGAVACRYHFLCDLGYLSSSSSFLLIFSSQIANSIRPIANSSVSDHTTSQYHNSCFQITHSLEKNC